MGNNCCAGSREGMSKDIDQKEIVEEKVDLAAVSEKELSQKDQDEAATEETNVKEASPQKTQEDDEQEEENNDDEDAGSEKKEESEEEVPGKLVSEEEAESGSSDSEHSVDTSMFKISDRQKFFNGKKHLKKFIKRNMEYVDKFSMVECFGNSYDEEACEHIAKIIKERANDDLWYVDFSNMFVTRQATLPPSLNMLIKSIDGKPIQELYLHDNAFGPIGVAQFKDFIQNAPVLVKLSVTNCGLGPEATKTIANALLANEETKLNTLCISRSRVETEGAKALAAYFNTYNSLERLEIFQNGIRGEGSTELVKSLNDHALNGALKHLQLNDNYFSDDEPMNALFELIRDAGALEHLNIDSSNMDEESHGIQLVECLKDAACKGSLKEFSWSYDAFEMNDLIKSLLDLMGDQETWTALNRIELCETLVGPKRRNKLRTSFKEKGITLVLSDRQKDEEEGSDSEDDSDVEDDSD